MRVMFSIVALIALATGASALRWMFYDPNIPIHLIDTSFGQSNNERIDHLEARIRSHHLTTRQRINFPRSGSLETYYQGIRAPGDERGHLVASQFSGPAEWYNLSPQNARVNRNRGYQSITTDWYGAECEARRWLQGGPNRTVWWTVDMTYVADSNRPDTYHLSVRFEGPRGIDGGAIDTWIRNPFEREDSTFWICRQCRSNRHEHDDLRRRQLIEEGCSRS